MGNLPAVTIDARETRDMDDALWVERYEDRWKIFIYIADAAAEIPPNSEDDLRARDLIVSRYLPNRTLPMLPRQAETTLSLWPNKIRRVLAIEIQLDNDLERIDTRLGLTTIKSRAKLSYEQIPTVLTQDTPFTEMLRHAVTLSHQLLNQRRLQGALALYDLNTGWVTTEEGHLRQIKKHEATVGYIVVQELMVLANSAVAEFAVEQDIPLLFRNHVARAAAPDRSELMRQIEDALHTPLVSLDTVRQRTHLLLDRAHYGATLTGHYGLNLPAYLHATSPIRRYPDLLNHGQLRAHLLGGPYPRDKSQLDELAERINTGLEELRRTKANHMKNTATRVAQRRVERGRLRHLNDKQLERVVKVEARSGGCPSEGLIDEYERRLGDNQLPLVCITLAFTEAPEDWVPLRRAAVQYLQGKPELAVSVLAMASQMGWEGVEFHETTLSSAPPQFECAAQQGEERAIGFGTTKKKAKQHAALRFLAGRAAFALELDDHALAPSTVVSPVIAGKDPISELQEWAQGRGHALPTYSFSSSGDPQASFVCNCEFFGVAAEGKATSKKEAKREAAKRTLRALSEGATNDPSLRTSASPNQSN